MTPRRTKFVFARAKRFYRPNELAEIISMDKKILLRNAVMCGALYRIGVKKLINLETLQLFFDKVGNLAEEIGGKYCQVKDAAALLGVDEEVAMQIASDADSMLKLREILLVDIKKLEDYVGSFSYKVEFYDIDEIEEQDKIERRRKYYV